MPDLRSFSDPKVYHILSYGTLLGSTFYQSFVAGVVAFQALPRPQFSTLQQKTFPIYFGMQTVLPVFLALTFPGNRSASSTSASGLRGFLAEDNRLHVFVPIVTMFVTGLANMAYLGPTTTEVMIQRKHQETRDGKKSYDKGPHSPEMEKLNKTFGMLHGVSTLVNLSGLGAMIWYAFTIATNT